MDDCSDDRIPTQKAKLSGSSQKSLRELGSLRDQFDEEELAMLSKELLKTMSDEELALWYEQPVLPVPK